MMVMMQTVRIKEKVELGILLKKFMKFVLNRKKEIPNDSYFLIFQTTTKKKDGFLVSFQ